MIGELSIYFDNPATDPLGYEQVEGKLVCGPDQVTLSFKVKDRAFRKSKTEKLEFPYGEVESVSYKSHFFGPKILTLRTRGTDKLDQFPGADVGRVRLHVTQTSRDEAKKAAEYVDYQQSEAYLQEQDDRLKESRKESPRHGVAVCRSHQSISRPRIVPVLVANLSDSTPSLCRALTNKFGNG